ncbi:MAG: hypothetical protein K0R89_973 [Ramlibacter sp.]|jgi:hypothetical protein|nr:hypothetical protein [Ramlibacter sp.]
MLKNAADDENVAVHAGDLRFERGPGCAADLKRATTKGQWREIPRLGTEFHNALVRAFARANKHHRQSPAKRSCGLHAGLRMTGSASSAG